MQVQDIYKTKNHQRDRHVCKNDYENINNNKQNQSTIDTTITCEQNNTEVHIDARSKGQTDFG